MYINNDDHNPHWGVSYYTQHTQGIDKTTHGMWNMQRHAQAHVHVHQYTSTCTVYIHMYMYMCSGTFINVHVHVCFIHSTGHLLIVNKF